MRGCDHWPGAKPSLPETVIGLITSKDWRALSHSANFSDEAIRKENIPPMLIVFPNGLASSMWCDSNDGKVPMETILIKELIPHIDKTHRTQGCFIPSPMISPSRMTTLPTRVFP
ncbi:hypothetical protein BH11PLA2_BH11PLA2_46940 [soil metagenome]